MNQIVDCFLFYNEIELLKFKLKELNDVVDFFVLVESTFTHNGSNKILYYNENKEIFKEYTHKIIHVIHNNNITNETKNAWNNEKEQRFYGTKGIEQLNLADDDIIILSDLDEIADKNTLKELKENGLLNPISCLEQDMYYYNLNNKIDEKWYQSKIVTLDTYKKYITNYDNFNELIRPNCGKHIGSYPIIKKGGWHFSYFGGINMIKNKLKNFAHQEMSHFADESDEVIDKKIYDSRDLFNRENCKIEYIPIEDNNYLPENYKMIL